MPTGQGVTGGRQQHTHQAEHRHPRSAEQATVGHHFSSRSSGGSHLSRTHYVRGAVIVQSPTVWAGGVRGGAARAYRD
ncbi:hypothetical protein GCM10010398_61220 [Streptomyces fimbriatus]